MDFDFDENPILKFAIIGVIILLLVGGGLWYYKSHKKAPEQETGAGQFDYLFASLPETMTLQAGISVNPFIMDNNQVRLPTDAKLVYVYGYHYVYSVDQNSSPVIFTSETIDAKYTGPNILNPIGVEYTAQGSDTSAGIYSNFWNFYYINGMYVGTVAINGAPSIITTDALPSQIVSNFFNYGMATAMVTEINGTQILLILNQADENGTAVTYGWWFMPDRIVFEKVYTVNGTTNEYTYYMQINADESQFMTLALGG